jgi:hypothetical protein
MKRGPGRPPLSPDDRGVSVSTRLPAKELDALIRRAYRARRTVSAQVRREILRRNFRPEK